MARVFTQLFREEEKAFIVHDYDLKSEQKSG